jgi:monofunctional glycosyltransferase
VKRWIRRIAAGAALALTLFIAWLGFVWPPPLWWRTHWPARTAFMAMRARQVDTLPAFAYFPIALDSMSRWLPRAATVAEDDAFFQHHGIDWKALGDVVGYRRRSFSWRDADDRRELRRVLGTAIERRDRLRGASTITQQLAKNLYLSPSRNPLRKVKEAVITWQLERSLPKERILALYLNVAELGSNVWGVEAASRRYFDRGAGRLSMEQAASLMATLPHPLSSNPAHRPGRMRWRANLILRRLRGENIVVPEAEAEDTVPALPPLPVPPPVVPDSLPLDTSPPDSAPADTTLPR